MKRLQSLSYKTLFIILFFSLAGIVFFLKIGGKTQKVSAAWWDEMWHYRKAISISNTSGSDLTDFQVSVSIGTSQLIADGKMQTDCDDIRITDINGNLLPYWIEENNPGCNQLTDTKVWLKANSLPTSGSTIYVYYGNSSASNNENGDNVFDFFDDFNDAIKTQSNWTATGTGYTVAGGNLYHSTTLEPSNSFATYTINNSSGFTNGIIESRMKPASCGSSYGKGIIARYSNDNNEYIAGLEAWTGNYNHIGRRVGGAWTNIDQDSLVCSTSTWYQFKWTLNGTNQFLSVNGVASSGVDSSFSSGKIGVHVDNKETPTGAYWDYIFVHKYASSEPTVSTQSEESGGGPIAYWKFDNNELSNGYTQLSYATINNNSTHGYLNSINTNITYNNATKLEFTMKSTDTVGNIVLVSGYSSASTRGYPCILSSGGNIAPSSFTTSTLTPSNVTRAQVSDGTVRTFTLDFTSNSTDPISFGSWADSSWSRNNDWYSFKIWDNNTLVRSFVPAKRNSDGVIGFYDTLNNTFYTNAGTGSFTAGPEITSDSAGKNNGTLGIGSSAPTWVDESQCISGKCLQFSGNNYINNINTSSLLNVGANANLTISAWIKPSSTSSTVFTKGLSGNCFNYGLRISGGNLLARNSSGDYNLGGNISTNTWQHVTVVYSNSGATGYLNGKMIGNNVSATTSNCTNNQWVIGARAYNALNTENFSGLIDEVKIYPYARTADQIKQDYNSRGSMSGSSVNLGVQSNTTPSLKSSLVAYWKFDENNGMSVYDSSGNNHTGTFIGTTTPTWQTGKHRTGVGFSGVNDSIFLPYQPDFRNAFSVSIWFKRTTDYNQTTDIMLLSPPNAWYFYDSYNSGAIRGDVYIGGVRRAGINVPIPFDGNWYHVVYTYDSATHIAKMYKNSKLYQSVDLTNLGLSSYLIDSATGNLSNLGWNTNKRGIVVDEAKIYNRALTDEEVKQDYNAGSAIQFGSTSQSIGGTTTSLEYCIPGDTSYCAPPIAEWKMDEGIGTSIVDTSGNNNTGTISGATFTQGKIGRSLNFDGLNDVVDTGSSFASLTTAFTISTWVNPGSTQTAYADIFGNHAGGGVNGIVCQQNNTTTNQYSCIYGNGSVYISTPNFNLQANTWQHLTFSKNSTGTKIYINAIEVGNTTSATSVATSNYNFKIGQGYISSRFFNGKLDHFKIYNYARTPAQIAYDYNKGNPIGWWKLDECQGNIAYDSSGVGNTGVIVIGSSGTQNSIGTCQIGTSAAWTNGASGKINSSLNFDGVDDLILINNVPKASNGTISVWIKPANSMVPPISSYPSLVRFNSDPGLYIQSGTAKPYIQTTIGTIVSNQSLVANQWQHLVGTYKVNGSNTDLIIYINGKQTGITSFSGTIPTSNETLGISNATPFNGQIDDVRIYNYALTDEQIKQIYNGGAVNFQ